MLFLSYLLLDCSTVILVCNSFFILGHCMTYQPQLTMYTNINHLAILQYSKGDRKGGSCCTFMLCYIPLPAPSNQALTSFIFHQNANQSRSQTSFQNTVWVIRCTIRKNSLSTEFPLELRWNFLVHPALISTETQVCWAPFFSFGIFLVQNKTFKLKSERSE